MRNIENRSQDQNMNGQTSTTEPAIASSQLSVHEKLIAAAGIQLSGGDSAHAQGVIMIADRIAEIGNDDTLSRTIKGISEQKEIKQDERSARVISVAETAARLPASLLEDFLRHNSVEKGK